MRRNHYRTLVGTFVLLGVLAAVLPVALAYPPPTRVDRLSVTTSGGQLNGSSFAPRVSKDGRFVAFMSSATNLVDNDTNGFAADVFVEDRTTGSIELVSVKSDGTQVTLGAEQPTISADGRFVAFTSFSRMTSDSRGVNNIYVHDRVTSTTELVTVVANPEGKSSFGVSAPAMSDDGRYVVFGTARTDLVTGIPPSGVPPTYVYVRDRVAQTTEVVSVADDGSLGAGSLSGGISGDGRFVAFYSSAVNLVPGDTNGRTDVFVRDRVEGATERISVSHDGSQSNAGQDGFDGGVPVLSFDGRFVAFTSTASNLVPHDSNAATDVFVHDRQKDTTERVSVSEDGTELASASHSPVMSADGRYLGFVVEGSSPEEDSQTAGSTDETAGRAGRETSDCASPCPVPPETQVFLHDRDLGSTELVSRTGADEPADGTSGAISLSGDASLAAFFSVGSNLVAKDTNGREDVFVVERGPDLGIVELRATRSGDGTSISGSARFAGVIAARAEDPSTDAGIGRDVGAELTGASVAFRPEHEDTHIRMGVASLPSQTGVGAGAPGLTYALGVTLEGTRYEVRATRVGPGGAPDFSLYRCTVVCERTATLEGGLGSAGLSVSVSVPFDLLPICCDKALTQLTARSTIVEVDGPATEMDEVELPDALLGEPRVETAVVSDGTPPEDAAFVAAGSLEQGRFTESSPTPTSSEPGAFDALARACLGIDCSSSFTVGVESPAPEPEPTATPTVEPTPDDTPEPEPTPIPRDRTSRLSVPADGGETDKFSSWPAFSTNGRYVAFFSQASNLVPGGAPGQYVADRIAGTIEFITPGFTQQVPDISATGRYVVFDNGRALVEDDTNFLGDVYLFDRKTRGFERISVSSEGDEANLDSMMATISDDGRYVAFDSIASNLVEGDTNGEGVDIWQGQDVFVRDRQTGTTERISVSSEGEQGDDHSFAAVISRDGTTVAFISAASNLVAGDTNSNYDLFVRDLTTGTTELVSVASDGSQGEATPSSDTPPAISADGRYVAFASTGPMVPGDHNLNADVFVHDRVTGITERVSVTSAGAEADFASSFRPDLSGDGRYVVFDSGADLLAEGESDPFDFNTYTYDRLTGLIERTSIDNLGSEGEDSAFRPATSPDGRYVAFESRAPLVSEDTNGVGDVYLRDQGPEIGIGAMSAELDDDSIALLGWASFSGAVIAEREDDNDVAGGITPAGSDLLGGRVAYRPSVDDLLFRLDVDAMPSIPFLFTGSPGLLYGWSFSVEGVDYELRATNGQWLMEPLFALYDCDADPCTKLSDLPGGYGSAGHDVRIAVPLSAIDAEEGGEVANLRGFSALGDDTTGGISPVDAVELEDATIPRRTIAAGIATAGTPRDEVNFDTSIERASDDSFTAALDASALATGLHDVWVKACIGVSCGAESSTVNVAAREFATSLSFTDTWPRHGQYSDSALVEAVLTADGGLPVAEATVSFELVGAERIELPVITDDGGVATARMPLVVPPGQYELRASYPGEDGIYGPSSAAIPFVIEKEEAALALEVEGKGRDRTLSARLVDADSLIGMAGRVIRFYADGDPIGQSTTSDDGSATLQAPPRYRGGKHRFSAIFDGDDFFHGASDEMATEPGSGGSGGSHVPI